MAGVYDITDFEQGSTYHFRFQFGTPVLDVNGDVVLDVNGYPTMDYGYDWTGCSAKMQFRKRHGDPLLAEFSTEDGSVELLADGWVDVTIPADVADTINITTLKYDFEATFANLEVRRLLMGKVINSLAITQEIP